MKDRAAMAVVASKAMMFLGDNLSFVVQESIEIIKNHAII